MPTILTHPAVALPFVRRVPRRVLFCGVLGSITPDADVVAFAFGIPYEHTLKSEVVWVWLPSVAMALLGKYFSQVQRKSGQQR